MVLFDTSYAMSRCEYSYYVTLLPCNQFHQGATGGRSSHRGAMAPWPPLRTATAYCQQRVNQFAYRFVGCTWCDVVCTVLLWLRRCRMVALS